jgi:ATP-binding cassette, subfamily B, bacterial
LGGLSFGFFLPFSFLFMVWFFKWFLRLVEMEKKKVNPLILVLKSEWAHLGDRKGKFILYMSLFVIAGLIQLMSPLVIGSIFNSIQESISSKEELMHLLKLISLLLVITIGFWIFHGIGRILEQVTGFHVYKNYKMSKVNRVLSLPVKWHKDNHSGDTIDKINRGGEAIANFSQHTTFDVVYGFTSIFGSLLILFFIDWKIALFALFFSILTLFVILNFDKKLIKLYKALNKFSNKVSAAVFDYLSNIITVITLRLRRVVSIEIDERLMASFKITRKVAIINESKWAFTSVAISFMTVIALIYRSYTDYMATGAILIGILYMLYGYLKSVGQTFYNFASLYGKLIKYGTRLANTEPIDEAYESLIKKTKGRIDSNWKEIEIENLNFSYEKEGKKQHLEKVNLKLERGKKIALVGESGSGKSTVLSLLRGLYPPEKGKVICDGKELSKGFEKLKSKITLIPQDPEIFNNTIGHNITFGLKTTREDVAKVIRIARFKKVIDRLEKGLNTNVLEKGVSLSGGEKQRLALARGLLAAKNSQIVLLDEPTSSVDSLNEIKIHEGLFREFKGKTIVSSIHRLHLLDKFDYIYFFESGKIIAEGTLSELKKNYKFKILWRKSLLSK